MRIVAVVIPLALLGAAPPARPDAMPPIASMARAVPECRSFETTAIEGRALVQKRGDLPSSNAYQAILRAGPDGCPDPHIASYGHGSPAGPKRTTRR